MRIASTKVADIVRFFRNELKGVYENGEIEIFIAYCFEEFIGMQRAAISLNGNTTVSESELLKFNFTVKDLKQHKPIQYILGKADFYGLKLDVNESVLIPRPETEELVHLIIKEERSREKEERSRKTGDGRRETEDAGWKMEDGRWKTGDGSLEMEDESRETGDGRQEMEDGGKGVSIIDIGTGSGCIAIALKKNIPDAVVYAIDISEKVLETARENALKNEVSVLFHNYDILSYDKPLPGDVGQFDIIVSNPPYIAISEKEQMEKNVTDYEPQLALFVADTEPLLFYKAITNFALIHLRKGGKVYFEINQKLGSETKQLLEKKGFKNVELLKDLNLNHRIITGTL